MQNILYRWVFSTLFVFFLAYFVLYYVDMGVYSDAKFSEKERKIKITLSGDRVIYDASDSFYVDGTKIVICEGGSYQFNGELENGQIIVDAPEEEIVELKLDSVKIHCEESSPLFIKKAKKVKIKLKDGSENFFSDGTVYEEVTDGELKPKSCIYSHEDLTIKGENGSLKVEGNYKNGIHSSDDLLIKGGNIEVNAVKNALRGNHSVKVKNGNLMLKAKENGIYSGDKVLIQGGQIEVHAKKYGIFGRNTILIREDSHVSIENALSPLAGVGEKEIADTLMILDESQ